MRRCHAPALAILFLSTAACAQPAPGDGTATGAAGAPVEAGPANVPEFKPAFQGQTRAPEVKTATRLEVREVASGLNRPWALGLLPDGRMLVTEKAAGTMRIISADGEKSPPIQGLPASDNRNQGGLLDVELDPAFAQNGLVYWSYAEPREGGSGTAVARGRLVADSAAPRVENVQVIFRMQPTLESTMHFGGRLVFAPDGMLFVALGERSVLPGRVQAQRLDSHFGKIVRIAPDGSVPKDNPFVGKAGALPEIWSIGHRNILAAALDAEGRLWEVEMGPQGGDELNRPQRGLDYGWPTIGYGEEYSGEAIHRTSGAAGMEQPLYYWDPVISPSGMLFYRGTMFPEWQGNALVGGLSGKALVRLVLNGDRVVGEERLLTDRGERIRDVAEAPDGAIWVLTDSANGKLLRISAGR